MAGFNKPTWDLQDPTDQTNNSINLGYASQVNKKTILRNPEFLKDLQDKYDPHGIYSDDELIERFYSDENWAQLNTIGAVDRAMEGGGDTDDEKLRNARLASVWDNLPYFYQQGGRGSGALKDIAKSVLLDPVNLIGGVAGKAVARGAMRTATALGKPAPVTSTLKGIGAAAGTEALISGGQEGIINVAEQSYRQDIGLQDGFDLGQFAKATAFGTVLGGAVGGAIGTPFAISGTRQGMIDAEAAKFTGQSPETTALLTNAQADETVKLASRQAGPYQPEEVVKAKAEQADVDAEEVPEVVAPKTATDTIIEELEGQEAVFQRQILEHEDALKKLEEDGASEAAKSHVIAELNQAQINAEVINRLKNERDQINVLKVSNVARDQNTARQMQNILDQDVAKARVALKKGDAVTVRSILADAEARAKNAEEVAADAAAAKPVSKTTKTTKTKADEGTAPPPPKGADQTEVDSTVVSSKVDEPSVTEVKAPEQKAIDLPEPNWGKKAGGAGQEQVNKILADAGFTPEQANDFLKENIANGNIPTTPTGVIKRGSPNAVRNILKGQGVEAKADAPTEEFDFGKVIGNLSSANNRVTDPDEMRKVIIDQAMRNQPSRDRLDLEKQYDKFISEGEKQRIADDELIMKLKLTRDEELEVQDALQDLRQAEARYKDELTFKGNAEDIKNYVEPTLEEQMLNARKIVLARRADKGMKSPRNAQLAIDRASILTTAGRSENGRIQSFIKWSSNRVGLDKSEQTFADRRMLDYGSALADAKNRMNKKGENLEKLRQRLDRLRSPAKKKKLQEEIEAIENESVVVPYVSVAPTNNVYSIVNGRLNTKTNMPKGSVLWVDGRNGKIFDSEDTANFVYYQKDIKQRGVSNVLEKHPLRKGNKILITKKKDGTDIRVANNKQVENGEGLKEILGKQKEEDWDVKYIDETNLTKRSGKEYLDGLWEQADEVEGADGVGVIRFVGDQTGNGMATPIENLSQSPLNVSALNEQQKLAFTRRHGESGSPTLNDVQNAIQKIEKEGFNFKDSDTDFAILVNDLEQLYSIQRDTMPGGIVRSSADRQTAIKDIEGIIADGGSDMVGSLKRMIQFMGGDPSKAPKIVSGSTGSTDVFRYGDGKLLISKTKSADGSNAKQFFHATSQWAYDNILTPEDRMIFWNSIIKDIVSTRGVRGKKLKDAYAQEQSDLPRQIFADQFTSWAFDNRSAGLFANKDKGYWKRMADIQKGTLDRYFSRREINPNLVPLFSKILPEEVRQQQKLGNISDTPQTKGGELAKGFKIKLKMAKDDMRLALADNSSGMGNPDRLVNAATEFRNLLAQAFSRRSIGGTLSWLRKLDKMGRDRLADLNYILSRASEPDEGRPGTVQDNLSVLPSPQTIEAKANLIEELFDHGHATRDFANARPYGGSKTDFTTLSELIRLMEEYTDGAYLDFEGNHLSNTTFNLKTGKTVGKYDKSQKRRANKKKEDNNNLANKATNVTKTPSKKRKYDPTKRVDYVTEATQKSYGDLPYDELLEKFREAQDTKLGDQIAWLMISKQKALPDPTQGNIRKEDGSAFFPMDAHPQITKAQMKKLQALKKDEMFTMFKEGVRTGFFTHGGTEYPLTAMEWEFRRRGIMNAYKSADKPIPKYLRQRIRTELNHGIGVATEDGIPPSAPIGAKTILSYMSHRDPEVQFTQRTMLYRMMNLMGKNVENTLGETNVMDASDIARLAGDDPSGIKNVSVDFRGEQFNKLRKNFRRMSIGLTKGNSNPFDAVHEIGHTIVRAGMLPKEEMDAVIELYRASDDTIKSRVKKAYAGKYDAPEAQQEELLAEEWFAESLAKYLGDRTMRGDVLKAMGSGNLNDIRLKNSFQRAFDRMIEYIAYVVNGLIGRKDIKQQFRRLTFYGDMFEAGSRSPLAGKGAKEKAVSPMYARDYANDLVRHSKDTKRAAIFKYNGGGKFSVNEDGSPIMYFHATPNGLPFKSSQVIMKPGGGLLGSGIYISPNSRAVEGAFANRPNPNAIQRMIDESELPEEKIDHLTRINHDLHELRNDIAQARRDLSEADAIVESHNSEVEMFMQYNAVDEEADALFRAEFKEKDAHVKELQNNLSHLLEKEIIFMDELEQNGLHFQPTVLPLVTRMINTFDMGADIRHFPDSPETMAVMNSITKVTNNFEGGNANKAGLWLQDNFPQSGLRGMDVYNTYQKMIEEGLNVTNSEAKEIFREALEDAGYDSLRAPHKNRISPTDGDTDTFVRGEAIEYDAFVVFNPENVKHINAEMFDAEDARLYYRDFNNNAQGFNGSVVKEMAEGNVDDLNTSNTLQMLEAVEDEGVSPPMVDAMSSILRQRDFTPIQEQAVRKQGPMAFLRSQSDRMERMGMNWLGKWYKDHFPNQHQTFASKYMPIHRMLRELPGSDGKVRAWTRAASGGLGQKQPETYTKIVSALRRGSDQNLSSTEKVVFNKIKDEFNKERDRMINAGMYVGYRRNYVPQIWSKQKIEKNREAFLTGMENYYRQEQTTLGNVFQAKDARTFAEKVYQSLTRESVDGVQVPEAPKSPVKGSTKNAQAESLDFNRVIELEKYPRAMREMEKFLEDDLEFLLVKYFEGSTRRTLHTQKFGLNSHGVDDYLYATQNGAKGIAKLLSTNRVYQKDFRSVTTDGVEEGVLRSETQMPFSGKDAEALKFAEELVELSKTQGSPAVRAKLEQIAVKQNDPTYKARVEAIVGSLQDYKGVPTLMETDDARFIENAMRVARKDNLNDFGGKAGLKASRALRTFNNVTLLGFTTLTSLGDLVLPIIRSGSFKDWTKSVYQMASDPDYRRALKEVGIAMENITHERMLNMYGAVDSKLSNAFFNATMLTPWTDMNRQVAGALAHQTFITHQRKALRSYIPGKPISEQPRDYKLAFRYMKNFGLQDYLKGGVKQDVSLSDKGLLEKNDDLRKAIIRFADESIFQPNANDTPIFAQTPLGALAFQLKSFPLMMTRLAGHVIREANLPKLLKGDASESNIKPLLYFATLGPAFGMGALAVKDIVQMRGGEDEQSPALRIRNLQKVLGYDEKVHGNEVDFWGWYMEGMLQMGGVGLLGDIFHSAVTQADNGSYGQVRFLQTLGGPSVGLVTSGLSVLGGTQDAVFGTTDSNAKERTALREIATRIPVVGGVRRAREGIVNTIAGEADSGGNSTGWGKGWKGSWN